MNLRLSTMIILAAMAVSACGGGNGGNSPSSSDRGGSVIDVNGDSAGDNAETPVVDVNGDSAGDNTEAPQSVISFSTSNVNFGRIAMGASTDRSITLTNTGNAPLVITNLSTAQKQSFTQTNDCNGLLPSGQNCAVNITFSPVGLGSRSDFLSVSGAGAEKRRVDLVGVGDRAASPANRVLDVDFQRLSRGAYREADLRSDFNVGVNGYNDTVHGPNANSMDIISDPANSGRGNVLRVLHREGRGGNSVRAGGFRFRADFPATEEYYFAYDAYFPNGWFQPLQHKMPAMMSTTNLLNASHLHNVTPHETTIPGFNTRMQTFSNAAYGRGDGSFSSIVYDKESVQQPRWANYISPTDTDFRTQRENLAGQYIMPRGRWVKIEQRVKLNTVNVRDGLMQIWMDGELIYDQTHLWLADTNYPGNLVSNANRKIDGVFMYSYYGGNPSDPRNRPPADNYHYYDNFIVSASPITH